MLFPKFITHNAIIYPFHQKGTQSLLTKKIAYFLELWQKMFYESSL